MLHIWVLATLAATPAADAPKAEPVKLASPGFSAVNVDDKLATFYSDHFANQLTLQGLRVLTASEIGTMIGFERQKELLGCTDESQSCMAELANALGVDALIVGSIAKFDSSYQLNLKIVSSSDATPLSAFSGSAEGDKGMLARLNDAARAMAPEVFRKLRPNEALPKAQAVSPAEAVAVQTEPGDGKRWPWIPTVAGGVALVVGTGMMFKSFDEVESLRNESAQLNAFERSKDAAMQRSIAVGSLVVGAALVGGAALTYVLADDAKVTPTAMVTPGGAGIGLVGVLP